MNALRVDFDSYEASKERLREIHAAREEALREAETRTDSVQVSRGKRGPAKTPGSARELAKRTGIPAQTIRDTERHVEVAELATAGEA